jgi:regulator of sigma E protease
MRTIILANASRELEVVVLREGKPVTVKVTPEPKGDNGGGLIGVAPASTRRVPVAVAEAVSISIARPADVVYRLVVGLGRIITGKEKASLTGPVGISKEIGKAAHRGLDDYLNILGMLSAYLGGFNLLPIPALDGGRLMFLVYEGVARRKPNARIEAHIHAIGLLMFLALMVVVSVFDIRGE